LLLRFGLPVAPRQWQQDDLIAVMRNDKKAVAGRMRFVLPHRLGSATLVDDVTESDVHQVLRDSWSRKL
jgi:3-dehydroquinate synthase